MRREAFLEAARREAAQDIPRLFMVEGQHSIVIRTLEALIVLENTEGPKLVTDYVATAKHISYVRAAKLLRIG